MPGSIRQSCKEKDPLCREALPYSKPILSRATEAPGAAGMVTCLLSPLLYTIGLGDHHMPQEAVVSPYDCFLKTHSVRSSRFFRPV